MSTKTLQQFLFFRDDSSKMRTLTARYQHVDQQESIESKAEFECDRTRSERCFAQISSIVSRVSSSFTDNKYVCNYKTLTYCYDLLTILISLADVITDILVIYKFYIDKRKGGFALSIVVMILAQLSYPLTFIYRFCPQSCLSTTVMLCIMFLLTPVVPCICYWCEVDKKNCLIKLFGIADRLNIDTKYNHPKMKTWIKTKARKHMGFILQAMIEALPQSIIQMIAIVYYQERETIYVISICVSLLNVAINTMVFHISIDFKVFIYNWLSFVCDYFGLFAIICWYVK